jgi:uncharacterized protein YoaH (UPF0181 family)
MADLTEQQLLSQDPEVLGLQRQRQLANLLTGQAFNQPQGQVISGHYVKPSALQQALPMINAAIGGATNANLDTKQQELANALRQQKGEAIGKFQELMANPATRGEAMQYAAKNPHLQSLAQELMKPRDVAEGGKVVIPGIGAEGIEIAKGNPKYHAPIHVDRGNMVELRDPNDPTKVLQTISKGVAPGEAARLGYEGIPYGGGQGAPTGLPQGIPTGQPQGQGFTNIKLPNGQTQPVDFQSAGLMPPLITAGMSPKAVQEAKTTYAQDLQTNINNAYQVYKVAGEIEKKLPEAHGSGIGNIMGGVANFVGYESDKNAADAQLKVMSDKLLKAVPRFSGPQSDKDVQSYREAAGSIGDASLPMNVRLAALETIKNLNKPYAPNLNWESQVPKEEQKVHLGPAPMYATNGSTRIMSTDGGKTWQPAR